SHFGRRVLVVGGGNSAVEAALELWRAGVRVSLVHRGADVKTGVKYWLRPDIHNRIAEGSIPVRFEHRVTSFEEGGRVHLEDAAGRSAVVEADQVLVLIGYEPELELLRRCGAGLDMDSGVPVFDPISCETDRPGLYVAGAVQSGRNTDRIFIDNSR